MPEVKAVFQKVCASLRRLFCSGKSSAARTEKQKHGDEGEAAAAQFLQRERGMKLIARNWRSPKDRRDELDLVCRDGEVLVFVEVKTRAATAPDEADTVARGYGAVDRAKKAVLRRASAAYLRGLGARGREQLFRYDIVVVGRESASVTLRVYHFENVAVKK